MLQAREAGIVALDAFFLFREHIVICSAHAGGRGCATFDDVGVVYHLFGGWFVCSFHWAGGACSSAAYLVTTWCLHHAACSNDVRSCVLHAML